MTPGLVKNDGLNGRGTNSELSSQRGEESILPGSRVEATANLEDFTVLQFGIAICFTLGMAILFFHILVVVGVSTKEEVHRPDTDWVVATMENVKTFGDGTVVEFPREAMRLNVLVANADSTIAVLVKCVQIKPALSLEDWMNRTGLSYPSPETVLGRGVSWAVEADLDFTRLDKGIDVWFVGNDRHDASPLEAP